MVLHVSFRTEALAAPLRALEGPLVGVDEHVDPKVLLLAESLLAGGLRALKGLGAVMKMEVGVQANFPGEDLLAVSVRALDQVAITAALLILARASFELWD